MPVNRPERILKPALALDSETGPCFRRFDNCVASPRREWQKGISPYNATYIPWKGDTPNEGLQPGSSPEAIPFPFPFTVVVPRIGASRSGPWIDARMRPRQAERVDNRHL